MTSPEEIAEWEQFAAQHGIPALLDHLGLDGLGNEVNELYRHTGHARPPANRTGREPINLAALRVYAEAPGPRIGVNPTELLALIDAVEAATALLPIAEILDSDLTEETPELTRLREALARFDHESGDP